MTKPIAKPKTVGKDDGLRRAAEIADLYADENFRMAGDTILADPILNERFRRNIRCEADLVEAHRKSESLTLDGHMYASRAHAAQDIARAIREEIEDA